MGSGKIILINGASSSGKTSLVHALQGLLPEPYLEAGIDKFIYMLPRRYLERPLWDEVLGFADRAGPFGRSLFSGMHHAVAALSRAGINVLADHVLVEPVWVQECTDLFAGLPAYLIGVHCPLVVLEQREKDRRSRTLGQARRQYEIVHAHCLYDLEVDTSLGTPVECAGWILERIQSPQAPQAFRQLKTSREASGR